jgi:hypothetical protein
MIPKFLDVAGQQVCASLFETPLEHQASIAAPGRALPRSITAGTIYIFSNVGDVIRPHVHAPNDGRTHLTLILEGAIRYAVHAPGENGAVLESVDLRPGALFPAPEGVPHSFTALEVPARLANLRLISFNVAAARSALRVNVAQLREQTLVLSQAVEALGTREPAFTRWWRALVDRL